MRLAIVCLLTLTFCAAIATAEQPREQRDAAPMTAESLGEKSPGGGCDIGNLAAPTYNFGNWIRGGESYAYLIQPQSEGCDCEKGFKVERIYMMMQFAPGDVPEDFSVYVGLADAVWDEAAGVYRPGEEYCTSATSALTAATAGLYDIYVDLDGDCACATIEDAYFITFHLPQPLVWWADALEDDTPAPGVSYFDNGSGWQDLVVDYGWWGNNIMHAEISCCNEPVGNEAYSLDALKALYR